MGPTTLVSSQAERFQIQDFLPRCQEHKIQSHLHAERLLSTPEGHLKTCTSLLYAYRQHCAGLRQR